MYRVTIFDAVAGEWLHFGNPVEVLECRRPEQVDPLLSHVEHRVEAEGLYAAGFLAYDAAAALDPSMIVRDDGAYPSAWFGLYRDPLRTRDREVRHISSLHTPHWMPALREDEYVRAIHEIKGHIRAGDTYQVNYTYLFRASFAADPYEFFWSLISAQQCAYGAFIDTPDFAICSASPELFFRLDGDTIVSRPMKGTAARGLTLAGDREATLRLQNSEKDRAENVMIVDMVRNDIGRIARPGSVGVSGLFSIERYPTVLQMTSAVHGKTDASVCNIFRAMFPAASITGAPKISTMNIIAGLEHDPRHVYTGSVGFLAPDRVAQFNVAIRTALIEKRSGMAEYGVGGGVVWGSVAEDEYRESQIKARILFTPPEEFGLLETMRWSEEEGYVLLSYHLQRLRDSAEYFGFTVDIQDLQSRLEMLATTFDSPQRLRIVLTRNGECRCERCALKEEPSRPLHLRLAPVPIDPTDPFLYHKTTRRQLYESARAAVPDCDDVLLWNDRGELTETSVANVVCDLGGVLVTPPVSAGLLPGTFRQWLLERHVVTEQTVIIRDLERCTLYLINSVRLWRHATLAQSDEVTGVMWHDEGSQR
jgi:para-aminobenzoate synthetase/4-amino-4-deoxychorismate lyase